MIRFLLKGIIRDKSRSFLPIVIIVIGTSLTIFLSGYIQGVMGDMVTQNAKFETGHVKIMTKEYLKNKNQLPLDLALLEITSLKESLQTKFPTMEWVERIRFGGLIDIPNEKGETKGQGPSLGIAINILSSTNEIERFNLKKSLMSGQVPTKEGEVLISHDFAQKLKVKVGDEITYFGSTMNGSMSLKNLIISGTIHFGTASMDKGTIIIDISDAQEILDMEDGASELLGYFPNQVYQDEKATSICTKFNQQYQNSTDEFAPIMQKLKDQNNLAEYIDYVDTYVNLFVGIFVFAMSIVLWNTGLLAGLRRYQEFGIRLSLGESKGQIYRSLIYEAILIGTIGSLIGTIIGLAGTYYLQIYGIDMSDYLQNSTVMMSSVLHSKVTPQLFYIGFIPGLLAIVLGNMLSGMGIYKRETASLIKEMEV